VKNNKSEKNKNVKGFYIALGISALMIGSACYFSYKEGDSRPPELSSFSSSSQYAVDRKETNIPKAVTTSTHRNNSYLIITAGTSEVSAETQTETTTVTTITSTAPAQAVQIITDEITNPVQEEESSSEESVSVAETSSVAGQPLKSPLNIIGEFSGQELVKNITTGSWQTHNGTDYKAEIGDDVYSVTDGNITEVNNDPLWGTIVVIQAENGDLYRYCNLSKELSVQKGTGISAGDVIGSVGDTADIESAIEPHLHIEVIRGGKYENPADFIKSEQ